MKTNFKVPQGYCVKCKIKSYSVQIILVFFANRNRNTIAKQTSVKIGLGIVFKHENLQIGVEKSVFNARNISKLFINTKKKTSHEYKS